MTDDAADEELPAVPASVSALRRRAVAFATEQGAAPEVVAGVALAVSEVVSNVVLHAYRDAPEPGTVRLTLRADGPRLVVAVADDGVGLGVRDDSPGLGHGLASVGVHAQALDIGPGPDGRGTVVRMTFARPAPPPTAPDLVPLCALALATVADVSCIDLIGEGVLRRAAAEVRDAPELGAWLSTSPPPTKPGTATWAAMREGGARLVEHDASRPRSPGGPGDRLDLRWWIAVPLEDAAGDPVALWGLGGRYGGRPVPGEATVALLAQAARGDLAEPAARETLRAQLLATDG
ncbi:ATP-binding protein [Paraconexibacter algicola]|uniref:Histidine kinase/HSP90-like ATPase domain-containing protein n=1 Tax=Paraconexibacter algicola TaxID=2133960 RepID=A0A2T4UGK2_9ACTN|nr:ATP-binding protein [Paraconexibacter algicola]PTL58347.1 hypothetical protein C7Y72_01125 [Paraconexibacter algicola]